MVNKAILVGRLGRDPEVRYTTSGTPVANFSLATDESWTDKNGERQRRTEWHQIVVWSRLAEICERYLRKGRLIFIEGTIQTREWEDRDGNRRRTTEIVARNMQMLGFSFGRGGYGVWSPAASLPFFSTVSAVPGGGDHRRRHSFLMPQPRGIGRWDAGCRVRTKPPSDPVPVALGPLPENRDRFRSVPSRCRWHPYFSAGAGRPGPS